mmetsp:Transcript_30014/g.79138  ORF Transcript_30014/g.79138 Transcript_30014/m.79138 type:complete len:122 (-) Transcript_30014:108-473(-)
MMTVDPAARPAADACLRHPWLRAGPCRPLPEAGTPLAETPHRDVLGCADAAACISSPAPEVVWQVQHARLSPSGRVVTWRPRPACLFGFFFIAPKCLRCEVVCIQSLDSFAAFCNGVQVVC